MSRVAGNRIAADAVEVGVAHIAHCLALRIDKECEGSIFGAVGGGRPLDCEARSSNVERGSLFVPSPGEWEEVEVEGHWVRKIKPRPQYAALFALDRAERFASARCYWLPGQVSSYLKTPRLQELCAEMQEPIPELIAASP